MSHPRPAPGMHLFFVEDEGILFSEQTQKVHVLNTSGAVIWCHLEDNRSPKEIAHELERMFGLEPELARHFVTTALADWQDNGFLEGVTSHVDEWESGGHVLGTMADRLPPWRPFEAQAERCYRLLRARARFRFESREFDAVIRPVIRHLEFDCGTELNTEIDILGTTDGIVIYQDRKALLTCPDLSGLAPLAKGALWLAASAHKDHYFLDIHAAVAAESGRCVLMPAAPGSGKSTLSAALVHAGFTFFSDEVAFIQHGTFHVHPVPLALCVKDTGLEVVARMFPQLRDLPLHRRLDGKRVRYLPPPADALPESDDPLPVGAVVFPRYQANAGTQLTPLGTVEAIRRLMTECVAMTTRLDKQRMGRLLEWLDGVQCYGLTFSSTEDAVSHVRSALQAK